MFHSFEARAFAEYDWSLANVDERPNHYLIPLGTGPLGVIVVVISMQDTCLASAICRGKGHVPDWD